MSTISLCMIVKNEEKHLEKCLESIKDLVDEIIIVDTGSTDKTKDVAKKHETRLYDFEWIDDFSAARNFSLEKATKDWIFWMDADETVDKKSIVNLKQKLEETKYLGFEVEIHNLSLENKPPFIHKSVRLLKNGSNIQFMNKIHEQPSINQTAIPYYEIGFLPIVINHIGYREDVAKDKDKKNRNFNILKEELKQNPKDRFLNFNIANEYLKSEDYYNALYHYKIATNNKKDNEMLSHSLLRMVLALYELKRYDEMFSLLYEGQTRYPDYTDIFYFQADILEKFGRDEEAKYLYELCLKKGNPKKNYVTRQGVGDILPLKKLSDLYLKGGFYKKAADALLKLIEINKYDLKVAISLMKLYKMNFSEFELELVINELYPSDDEQDSRYKMELAYSLRMRSLFSKIYPKVQVFLTGPNKLELDLFYHLSNYEEDIAKELLISQKIQSDLACIQYYLVTKDAQVAEYASEDLKKIISFLDTNKRKEAFHISSKTFILFLDEVIRFGDKQLIPKALELSVLFNHIIKGEIGNLLYSHLNYELAVEYYIKYLSENKDDFMITLMVSEIHLALGKELDALRYAHKAMSLNDEHFRSVEIILEVYKTLGEQEQAKSLAKQIMKQFPNDHYLNQF